jgi:hypothetical protein
MNLALQFKKYEVHNHSLRLRLQLRERSLEMVRLKSVLCLTSPLASLLH